VHVDTLYAHVGLMHHRLHVRSQRESTCDVLHARSGMVNIVHSFYADIVQRLLVFPAAARWAGGVSVAGGGYGIL
jgi:hypothetical protein